MGTDLEFYRGQTKSSGLYVDSHRRLAYRHYARIKEKRAAHKAALVCLLLSDI